MRHDAWRTTAWTLAAIVLALFRRPLTGATFFFRDVSLLFFPKKLQLVQALQSGIVPLWDPMTLGGRPYLAVPSNFIFYPGNLLFLFFEPLRALNLLIVLQFVGCAIAACWLARTLGLSNEASFLAGAAYAFAGFTVSSANLLPILLGMPWLPVTIGLAHGALARRSGFRLAAAGLTAGIPLLCGAAELTVAMFVILGTWIFFGSFAGVTRRRRFAVIVFLACSAIAISAVQTVPAAEVVAQSRRSLGLSYATFSKWSVAPQRIPEILLPGFLGVTNTYDSRLYWGRGLESGGFPYILSIYIGVVTLALALIGGLARTPPANSAGAPLRILLLLLLAGVALSLGSHLPFFRLLYEWVPGIGTFRFPAKALMLSVIPAAILAGAGLDSLRTERRMLRLFAAIIGLATGVCAAFALLLRQSAGFRESAAGFFFREHSSAFMVSGLQRSAGHAAFFCATALAAALLLWRGNPKASWILALTVTVDLAIAAAPVNFYAPRDIYSPSPLVGQVRQLVGDGRFHSADPRGIRLRLRSPSLEERWRARWTIETLSRYTAPMFGIPVAFDEDYDGLAPYRAAFLTSLFSRLDWPRRLPLLRIAGVRAFTTYDEVHAPGVQFVSDVTSLEEHPLHLYAIPDAASARFLSRVRGVRSDGEALAMFERGADPSTLLLHSNVAGASGCGTAPVTTSSRGTNGGVYRVSAPCGGYVVFSENWYPGWRVTVDGVPSEQLRANYQFSAVAVGPGSHVIVRTYAPERPVIGAVISLLALIAVPVVGSRLGRAASESS